MKTCVAALVVVTVSMGGCGGGGGGSAGGGEAKRVFVIPHVLESSTLQASVVGSADFNGDGVPDLVTLRESPTRGLAVQFSSGLRESPTKQSLGRPHLLRGADGYAAGVAHTFVWDSFADLGCADIDNDGCPDLVAAGGSAKQVGVWRCDPVFRDGFLSPVLIDTTNSADRVAVGDVNGDGRLDLMTMDETTGQAKVFLQASASPLTFVVGNDPPVVGACHGLVLCDMNRDGRLDCVTNDAAGNRVLFLFGGAAGFTLRESPTKVSSGKSMAVGDTDGDGWLDVVVVDEGGLGVTCLHQKPAAPGTFDDVHSPLGIAVNEDGTHNFAQRTVGGSHTGDVIIRRSGVSLGGVCPGTGRVWPLPGYWEADSIVQPGLGLADLDGDGKLDLVCAPAETFPILDESPVLVFGSTTTRGGFGPSTQRAKGIIVKKPDGATAGKACVCLDDVDQDGHFDIVASDPDNGDMRIGYVEDGDIPMPTDLTQQLAIEPTPPINDCATADFDRDGRMDCVTATTTGLEVRFQDTARPGTFLAPVILASGQDCRSVAIGDVNGDGCPDLVVAAGANGGNFLRDPLKPRSFLAVVPFPAAPQGTRFCCVTLGDLDGNGTLDVFAIRESPSKGYRCSNRSNGFFDVFTEVSLGITHPWAVEICDTNEDGRLDLVVAGDGPDGSCVVLQDSFTPLKFSPPQVLSLQRGVRVATGDVNGDGFLDVVTSGEEGVAVALQSTDVRGRFLPSYSLSNVACGGLAVGDFDRDGQPEVCFLDINAGTLDFTEGDPDFDLLGVIPLNGLPPGLPVRGYTVAATQSIGDPDFDLLVCSPRSGSTTGTIRMMGTTP